MIQSLFLNSSDLAAQRAFYTGTLGLPVADESTDRLTIQIGSSTLTFVHSESLAGRYHIAFDIPQNQFDAAVAWLTARCALLADSTGRTIFHHVDWNAHAVYFRDGDGNIAELIARHNLPTARMMPFSNESLIRISEIGLAVPNVIDAVTQIKAQTGLRVWRGAGSETFAAVGSETGLLIVVRTGRMWLPTTGTVAVPLPTIIHYDGVRAGQIDGLPYHFGTSIPEQL